MVKTAVNLSVSVPLARSARGPSDVMVRHGREMRWWSRMETRNWSEQVGVEWKAKGWRSPKAGNTMAVAWSSGDGMDDGSVSGLSSTVKWQGQWCPRVILARIRSPGFNAGRGAEQTGLVV